MMLVPKNLNEPFYEPQPVNPRMAVEAERPRASRASNPRRLIGHALIRAGRMIASESRDGAVSGVLEHRTG